jgi:hypothetical protein
MMLVARLPKILPPRYVAGPRVHLGAYLEVDVASYAEDVCAPAPLAPATGTGVGADGMP